MNTITINGKDYLVPASWNELTRQQLIYMAGLFALKLTVVDFKVHLMWKFLKLKPKLAGRIDHEDALGITTTFDFLLNDVSLTRNLLPVMKVKSLPLIRRYHGPDDAMMTCTFGEFTTAQMKMEDFARTGEDKYLDELVAVLYRPKKCFWWIRKRFTESTDCRVKFMEKDLPARAGRISKADHAAKYAVFLFVNGVMNALPDKFPNVYRKRGNSENSSGGWAPLIISLADGKTDDESLNRVFHSNMYNVFMGLEQKAIEYFKF